MNQELGRPDADEPASASGQLPALVIVGAGGHGRELYASISAVNATRPTWRVLGFVDDAPSHVDRVDRLGARLLGDTAWLEQHPCSFALGIGSSAVRGSMLDRFASLGMAAATIVHPGVWMGPDVEVGQGVVIYDRCTLTTNVRIGDDVHLNVGCSVQHDSVIDDHVQISPGVLINGDCVIGSGAFLGTAAVVTRGCRVGRDAKVGAGAVVIDDVPDGATVVGVPARVVRT